MTVFPDLPPADDDAPDPVSYPDGSEDLPPGDEAAEDEYRRDRDTWSGYDDDREVVPYRGGTDDESDLLF